MTLKALPVESLRRVCQASAFSFKTTAELEGAGDFIGQQRGTKALAFGLGMRAPGYNVFVAGESGTGRMTAVQRLVAQRAAADARPADWVYVHNFQQPHRPRALALPAGRGAGLQIEVAELLATLQRELPRAFATESGRQETRAIDEAALARRFAPLQQRYADLPEVAGHLLQMEQDMAQRLPDLLLAEEKPDLRRYQVNLFVDNGQQTGAPVVLELNPTYLNLIGRMEYVHEQGLMAPHFSTLRAGSLHRANGGYLILHARDAAQHPDAWQALQRALRSEQVRLQTPEALNGYPAPAQSLDPQPIPLRVKVILTGSEEWYYTFFDHEEEFAELFKVKAEFEPSLLRDEANEQQYAQFVARCCQREGLRHFTAEAAAKIVELGSRLCQDQNRLSAHFGQLADFVREADFWAAQEGREWVEARDVQQAAAERAYRASHAEERLLEQILQDDLLIVTEGAVVGQVNGLSVLDFGDYRFGTPGRITARTYMGEDGVVNIEREVDMAGPIHNKGLLTLVGYLGGTYAQEQPLSLSASLTFEQNYMEVDGDSASAAELLALLSSLSGLPVRQEIAVTGSINQHGELQAVGGATEKVEGFFRLCRQRGLSGEQGALIPRANVKNLMLDEEVVEAVAAGQFHVWATDSVDESLQLLLGTPAGERDETGQYPAGTVHHLVQAALQRLALDLKSFGDRSDHDQEQGQEDEQTAA